MPGIEKILAKRSWFVPEFTVWGLPGYGITDFLVVERFNQLTSVFFDSRDLGGAEQDVAFNQLVDHRGNSLPDTISQPMVLTRAKGDQTPFIVSRETGSGFKIARPPAATVPIQTDLFVVELGD